MAGAEGGLMADIFGYMLQGLFWGLVRGLLIG